MRFTTGKHSYKSFLIKYVWVLLTTDLKVLKAVNKHPEKKDSTIINTTFKEKSLT